MMWLRTNARIQSTERIARNTIRMDLEAPEIAGEASPGQFVHLLCGGYSAPFLRRPISLHTIDKQSGTVGLLFRVVGEGTGYLEQLQVGEEIDIMGPLGTGWPDISGKDVIMVAGGIGVAPMPAAALNYRSKGLRVTFLYGASTASELYGVAEVSSSGIPVEIATDDGSGGHHGFVTDLLKKCLVEAGAPVCVLACGPAPMLKAVQSICSNRGQECYVSLEQRMGCGVGACLGCTVKTTLEKPKYMKVCVDGPVFKGETVVIESV